MTGPPNADRRPPGWRDGDNDAGGQPSKAKVGQPAASVEPFALDDVEPDDVEPDVPEPTATPNLRVRRRLLRRRCEAACTACGWRTVGGYALARGARHALTCGPVEGRYLVSYMYGPGTGVEVPPAAGLTDVKGAATDPSGSLVPDGTGRSTQDPAAASSEGSEVAADPAPEWEQDHRDGPERAALGLSPPSRKRPQDLPDDDDQPVNSDSFQPTGSRAQVVPERLDLAAVFSAFEGVVADGGCPDCPATSEPRVVEGVPHLVIRHATTCPAWRRMRREDRGG